jgi:hypothetical protein
VNKLTTGLLTDKEQKRKRRVLTDEKLHATGARLEHTPRKSLKRLAQDTGVSQSSVRGATQFLKLRLYKTTAIHERFCSRAIQLAGFILQLVSIVCRRR